MNEPQQQGIQGRRRDRRESRIRRAGRIGLSWGSERHGQPGTGDRPCGIWTPVSCPWTCPAHPWLLQLLNSWLRNGFFFWGRLRVLNKFEAVCDENVAGLFLVHIEWGMRFDWLFGTFADQWRGCNSRFWFFKDCQRGTAGCFLFKNKSLSGKYKNFANYCTFIFFVPYDVVSKIWKSQLVKVFCFLLRWKGIGRSLLAQWEADTT